MGIRDRDDPLTGQRVGVVAARCVNGQSGRRPGRAPARSRSPAPAHCPANELRLIGPVGSRRGEVNVIVVVPLAGRRLVGQRVVPP